MCFQSTELKKKKKKKKKHFFEFVFRIDQFVTNLSQIQTVCLGYLKKN